MDDPLLSTKYAVPPVRAELVSRPHLISRLNAGLERAIILVSAPAGYGKTTLVSMWLSQFKGQVAWLSLDETDNDSARFLRYVAAALQSVVPGIDKVITDLSVSGGLHPLTHSLIMLINQIATLRSNDPSPLILVLDDYHTITTEGIHKLLAFLIDHLPVNLHLVVITRSDPPLPLSRLRARNQLLEIRMEDLRFTPVETSAFLNQSMGVHLSANDILTLSEKTEGWIVGLQMAALTLQSPEMQKKEQDAAQFIQAFMDSNRYILDYLVEEVLERQPVDIQTFLLHTSILNRLTGALCDAVTGNAQHSAEMLERLEHANLFIVPLGSQRVWYRYHPLFADLLRQRLHRTSQPSLVAGLHYRASRWYEENGYIQEAIEHAIACGDLDRAANLTERGSKAVLMRGELITVRTWLRALPDEMILRRPLLSLYHAAVLLLNGEPPAAIQPYLQAAAGQEIPDTFTHGAETLHALLALWQGDIRKSVQLGRQALASLPEQNLFWRCIVTGNLGIAYLYTGKDQELAIEMLEEAARIGERIGSIMGAVIALCNLAELRIVQGQLWTAKQLYDRALAIATDEQGNRLPIGDMAIIGIANLFLEWNDLQTAEQLLTKTIDLHSKNLSIWGLDGYLALARLRLSQGDDQAALDAIEHGRAVAASTGATMLDDWFVEATQARLWIARGNLKDAESWADRRSGIHQSAPPSYHDQGDIPYALWMLEHLTLAELWIARGELRRALDLLAALLESAEALQRTDDEIKLRIRICQVHWQLHQPEQALQVLGRALEQAQPGGYVRTFVDQGTWMSSLLRKALAQNIAAEMVQRLLAAFGTTAAPPIIPTSMIEPLSDREMQVLRLLATHLSSTEIGQELYISANTVRFHMKNIYDKLNAHTRKEAIQQAKELGLI